MANRLVFSSTQAEDAKKKMEEEVKKAAQDLKV